MIPSDRTSEMALGPTELALERLAAEGRTSQRWSQRTALLNRHFIRHKV